MRVKSARTLISLSIIFFITIAGYVASKWVFGTQDGKKRQLLEFTQVIDIGFVEPDKDHVVQFPLRNASGHAIRLSQFTTSCGCAEIVRIDGAEMKPLKEDVVLAPNEILEIAATISTWPGIDQRISQTIQFVSDLPGQERCSIALTGRAIVRLYPVPKAIVQRPPPMQITHVTAHLIDARDPSRRRPFSIVLDHSAVSVTELTVCAATPSAIAVPDGCLSYRLCLEISVPQQERVHATARAIDDAGDVLCLLPIDIQPDVPFKLIPSQLVFGETSNSPTIRVDFVDADLKSAEVVARPDWVSITMRPRGMSVQLLSDKAPRGAVIRDSIRLRFEMSKGAPQTIDVPVIVVSEEQEK